MDLNCSEVTLVWYPGAAGSTDDPFVLLSMNHYVPVGSTLESAVEQMVQVQSGHRWDTINAYPRGNVTTALTWQEVREIADPMEALETALAIEASLPSQQGWMSIELARRDTTWKVVPATIRGIRHTHEEMAGLLFLTFTVECGLLSILEPGETPPSIYPDGEILAGPTTNRGAFLLGPNRTYPAP